MEYFTIEQLSVVLNIELGQLLIKATKLNKKYKLGIDDFYKMKRTQYDIIRSVYDTGYLITLVSGETPDRKYNYAKSAAYRDLVTWLSDFDLNNFSTADIKSTLPKHIPKCGMQTVAAAMRSLGYENKVVYLDNKKQGRRWFKYINDIYEKREEPSFL